MLNVPHFGKSTSNTICVQKLLTLVHDGCIWSVRRTLIDEMLIIKFIALPHQGKDLAGEFVGKNKDKEIAQMMKENYRIVKKS